jgi:hypothetical protein
MCLSSTQKRRGKWIEGLRLQRGWSGERVRIQNDQLKFVEGHYFASVNPTEYFLCDWRSKG